MITSLMLDIPSYPIPFGWSTSSSIFCCPSDFSQTWKWRSTRCHLRPWNKVKGWRRLMLQSGSMTPISRTYGDGVYIYTHNYHICIYIYNYHIIIYPYRVINELTYSRTTLHRIQDGKIGSLDIYGISRLPSQRSYFWLQRPSETGQFGHLAMAQS